MLKVTDRNAGNNATLLNLCADYVVDHVMLPPPRDVDKGYSQLFPSDKVIGVCRTRKESSSGVVYVCAKQ